MKKLMIAIALAVTPSAFAAVAYDHVVSFQQDVTHSDRAMLSNVALAVPHNKLATDFSGTVFQFKDPNGVIRTRLQLHGKQYEKYGRNVGIANGEFPIVGYKILGAFTDIHGFGYRYELEVEVPNTLLDTNAKKGFIVPIKNGESQVDFYVSPQDITALLS